MPHAADADGAGQSLTEEPTNPVTCHPVVIDSGNKIYRETDFEGTGEMPLNLVRGYNKVTGFGIFGFNGKWSSSFDYSVRWSGKSRLCIVPEEDFRPPDECLNPEGPGRLYVNRPGGVEFALFGREDGRFSDRMFWALELKDAQGQRTGWELHTEDDRVETYDAEGRPLTLLNKHGIGWTYTYLASYPDAVDRITHSSGRFVQFHWTDKQVNSVTKKQLTSLTDPDGNTYHYTYVDHTATRDWRLAGVTMPNGETRTYHYEIRGAEPKGTLQHALTGVTINGLRYSNYEYYPDVGDPGANINNPAEYQDGRVKSSSLAGDRGKTTFSYSFDVSTTPATYTTAVTNAKGETWTYEYQGARKVLKRVIGPGANACPNTAREFEYENGFPHLVTDWNGNQTQFDYNIKGQLLRETSGAPGEQRTTVTEWATDHNAIKRVLVYDGTPENGALMLETVYEYYPATHPARFRLQSVTQINRSGQGVPNQTRVTTYSYTFHNNKIVSTMTVDGPLPGTQDAVTTTYSEQGDVLSVANALNHTTTYSGYNGLGLPAQVTDPNGLTTAFAYDERGRIESSTQTVDGVVRTTSYEYDALGRVNKATYADGTALRTARGVAGELYYTDYFDGRGEEFNHDLLGGVLEHRKLETDFVSDETVYFSETWVRDGLGRAQTYQGAEGQRIGYTYYANGEVETETDTLNRRTEYTYNSHNELDTVTDPYQHVTEYEYDWAGRRKTVTDASGRRTDYTFDGFGNLISVVSPDTGATSYTYDEGGRVQTMTRADGTVTSYGYSDPLGRLKTVTAGSQSVGYSYDSCANGKGRTCSVTYTGGSESYTYNITGTMASRTQVIAGTAYTLSWTYDIRDRVETLTYPGGVQAIYTYDVGGKHKSVSAVIDGASSPVASAVTYLPFGPVKSWTYGNGLTRTRDYDLSYRPDRIFTGGIQSLTYTFDTVDDLNTITNGIDSGLTQNFTYDSLHRLKTAVYGGVSESWDFDPIGNRTQYDWAGVPDADNPAAYSSQVAATYRYDAFNRLSSLEDSLGAAVADYAYNHQNLRTHKSGVGGNYRYLYDGSGALLAETTVSGSTGFNRHYIWLNGEIVGLVHHGTLYYVHDDHLGRPEAVTDASDAKIWSAKNFAYSRTVVTNGIGGFNVGFPGQYFDADSKLWYNWNRYYDAATGKYVQPDPIGLDGGLNTYAYALANPLNLVDLDGLQSWVISGHVQSGGIEPVNTSPVSAGPSSPKSFIQPRDAAIAMGLLSGIAPLVPKNPARALDALEVVSTFVEMVNGIVHPQVPTPKDLADALGEAQQQTEVLYPEKQSKFPIPRRCRK